MSYLSYPDIVKATRNIYDNVLEGAKFYLHRSMIGHLQSIITTTGAPVFQAAPMNSLAGFPVVSTEILPSLASDPQTGTYPFGVFGNLRRGVAMGERGSMTMAISEHATVNSQVTVGSIMQYQSSVTV